MEIIQNWEDLKKIQQDLILNIGNYDGVHIGHQELINEGLMLANKKKFAILTFNPHPRYFLNPVKFNRIITKQEMKKILNNMGVDYWIDLPFNYKIAKLAPVEFLDKITSNLSIKHIIVGYNFKFGYKASGNVSLLEKYLTNKKIGLSVHPAVAYEGEEVSSTIIRDLLQKGEIEKANLLMGRPYCFTGLVVKGKGRGKKIGFPTANLKIDELKIVPKDGVYAGYTEQGHLVAINIGNNPTFNGANKQTIEAHLIDLENDISLYGKELIICLVQYIREDIKFDNISQLTEQIRKDVEVIKKLNLKHLFTNKS